MGSQIVVIFISLLGIGIIIFCILSFFFPYGEKFKGKIQKIKGLGIDLEISIFTLFIIIGVILLLLGVYLQVNDYEKQLISAKQSEAAAKNDYEKQLISAKQSEAAAKFALAQSYKIEMRMVVSLEGISENDIPKIEDVKCVYFLPGSDEPKVTEVSIGFRRGTFKIILKDITSSTHILRLVFKDNATNRKWEKMNFMPLEPVFTLGKE